MYNGSTLVATDNTHMAKKKYCYDYPRPAVTVDIVLVTTERTPRILLIRRKHDPFAGCWAIPGGFVEMDESLEDAARRELREETEVEVETLEQFHTFGAPDRDPRGRTISLVYVGRVDAQTLNPRAADDAEETGWFAWNKLPELAFDHAEILTLVRKELKQ